MLLVLFATAASAAIALVALEVAAGVTPPRGQCSRTEFIHARALGPTRLLHPILALAAAWHGALLGVLGVAAPQWLAMSEAMNRYAESGWGDGLEVLGYLVPIQPRS